MGKFDHLIARYRTDLAQAAEDLKELEGGKWPWPAPDVENNFNQDLISNTKRNIDLFTRLVAAYEKHNA